MYDSTEGAEFAEFAIPDILGMLAETGSDPRTLESIRQLQRLRVRSARLAQAPGVRPRAHRGYGGGYGQVQGQTMFFPVDRVPSAPISPGVHTRAQTLLAQAQQAAQGAGMQIASLDETMSFLGPQMRQLLFQPDAHGSIGLL